MGKRALFTFVILTSIALIGVVSTQLYWIQSAIKVREENFQRSVNEAVSNVVYKLEKLEVIKEIQRTMYLLEGSSIVTSLDTASDLYLSELQLQSSRNLADNLYRMDTGDIKVQYLEDIDQAVVFNYDTSFLSVVNRRMKDINSRIFTGEAMEEQRSSEAMKKHQHERVQKLIRQKSSFFNEVLEDMLSTRRRRSVESRIDLSLVDSLIRTELSDKGITTEYEFGIFSPRRNLMVKEKTGEYNKELMPKSYAFNLFPKEVLRYPEYLMIYFPGEKRYLLAQMRGILAVSASLILAIIGAFAYIIFTIYRQKKLSEMKTDFINNMTHEFKTPIATVSLACEALTDPNIERTPELLEGYIHIIGEENHRLGSMAEKILQTAILEKGQVKLRTDKIDVHKVLNDVVKNTHIQVEAKGGKIATDFRAEESFIEADRVHITNVFTNLIDNANKYCEKPPEIIISTVQATEGIVVSVADNGIGISKANQKKIFDKLYRVSTGDIHNVKGFGLGLSYVKFIVERHGGSISVASEPGKGSTFSVFLPREIRHRLSGTLQDHDQTRKNLFPWKN